MSASETCYPRMSIDTQPYWDACKRSELLYQTCEDCGEPVFHPRVACPYCFGEHLSWRRSAGKGSIYSFTVQHFALDRERPDKLPRALGILQLDEGYHMFAEIDTDDFSKLAIGARVAVFFDRVADDLVLPKFKLDVNA